MDANEVIAELSKIQRERAIVKAALIAEPVKAKLLAGLAKREQELVVEEPPKKG